MYLVFDIESVIDWDLLVSCERSAGESHDDCVKRVTAEYAEKQGRENPFIPTRFHQPVSVVFIACDPMARYMTHRVISGDDPCAVAKEFWDAYFGCPAAFNVPEVTLVSFNGKQYDMVVMEVMAHRAGIGLPNWLVPFSAYANKDPRARYNNNYHLDLYHLLTAHTPQIGGGLDFWARLAGLPGKVGDVSGGSVAAMLKEHGLQRVNDYCMSDTLNTYGLLIHVLRSAGIIDEGVGLRSRHQLQAAAAALEQDKQWPAGGCVHQWIQALRAGLTADKVVNQLDYDDEPPF